MFGSDQIAKTPMVEPNCFQAKPVSIAKVSAVALHVRRCIYIYICTYIFNSDAVQWQHEYFIFTVLSGLVLHSEAMSGPTVCLRCSDLAPPRRFNGFQSILKVSATHVLTSNHVKYSQSSHSSHRDRALLNPDLMTSMDLVLSHGDRLR